MSKLEELAEKMTMFKNSAKQEREKEKTAQVQAEAMELAAQGILRLLEDEKELKSEIEGLTNSKTKTPSPKEA